MRYRVGLDEHFQQLQGVAEDVQQIVALVLLHDAQDGGHEPLLQTSRGVTTQHYLIDCAQVLITMNVRSPD